MSEFYFIVGSVMGTAEAVARALGPILEQHGHNCHFNTHYQPGDLAKADTEAMIIICTSNTGMGDLPRNITPLLAELQQAPPRIYGRDYGLIQLGDSSYPNFAQAGQVLDEALQDLGAVRLGDIYIIDAMHIVEPEAQAIKWLQDLLKDHPKFIEPLPEQLNKDTH